jgi:glycosyltransferase involved in cell wall biosynthesis
VLAEADIALVPLDDTLINRARCSAKLLELMAAGLPLVAAQVGQSGEYIRDGESGLLVPPGQPAALAQAALRLLADSGLRQRLSAGAQAALSPFSWAALAPRAEHAYMLAQQSPRASATY